MFSLSRIYCPPAGTEKVQAVAMTDLLTRLLVSVSGLRCRRWSAAAAGEHC